MANQVTLTFAGETRDVEKAFDRVGSSSEDMGRRVGDSGAGFDRAGEAADAAEGKAQGFADVLTGTTDIAAGTSEVLKGNLFEGVLMIGTGMADLAGGMAAFLIPALKGATTSIRAMSLALFTSPITWIILGILALIAVIVLIATKTDWFSRAWRASWGWIRNAAGAAGDWISRKWRAVLDWMSGIPGRLGRAFRGVANILIAPYRAAFNGIARAWNNTVGRLSWSVPSWVPFIGGNSISVPRLPTFHAGGRVPGNRGEVVPVLAMGGERFGGTAEGSGGGETWIRVDLGDLGDALLSSIARAVGRKGGQASALGIRVTR